MDKLLSIKMLILLNFLLNIAQLLSYRCDNYFMVPAASLFRSLTSHFPADCGGGVVTFNNIEDYQLKIQSTAPVTTGSPMLIYGGDSDRSYIVTLENDGGAYGNSVGGGPKEFRMHPVFDSGRMGDASTKLYDDGYGYVQYYDGVFVPAANKSLAFYSFAGESYGFAAIVEGALEAVDHNLYKDTVVTEENGGTPVQQLGNPVLGDDAKVLVAATNCQDGGILNCVEDSSIVRIDAQTEQVDWIYKLEDIKGVRKIARLKQGDDSLLVLAAQTSQTIRLHMLDLKTGKLLDNSYDMPGLTYLKSVSSSADLREVIFSGFGEDGKMAFVRFNGYEPPSPFQLHPPSLFGRKEFGPPGDAGDEAFREALDPKFSKIWSAISYGDEGGMLINVSQDHPTDPYLKRTAVFRVLNYGSNYILVKDSLQEGKGIRAISDFQKYGDLGAEEPKVSYFQKMTDEQGDKLTEVKFIVPVEEEP